jgi:hypothetical protein
MGRRNLVVACTLTLLAGVAGCSGSHSTADGPLSADVAHGGSTTPSPRSSIAPRRTLHVVEIAPDVGETFTLVGPDVRPRLSAQQAWSRYFARDHGGGRIPKNVTARLGRLVLLPEAADTLTYGFSSHGCPATRNPNGTSLLPNPCIRWLFLNANTGNEIDDTFQE